jgi:hypothetical protein
LRSESAFLIIVGHHRRSTAKRRNNVVLDGIFTSKQSNRSYPIGLRGQLSEAHIQKVSSEGTEQMVSSEGAEDQNTAAQGQNMTCIGILVLT